MNTIFFAFAESLSRGLNIPIPEKGQYVEGEQVVKWLIEIQQKFEKLNSLLDKECND